LSARLRAIHDAGVCAIAVTGGRLFRRTTPPKGWR
jgi:hypothetical protein